MFRISCEGTLIGVGNGDPNCQESDKEPRRSLFNGLAQAILQSTKTAGTIQATAQSFGLTPANLTITTKQVQLRPSV
jgi:beta-galactosidase